MQPNLISWPVNVRVQFPPCDWCTVLHHQFVIGNARSLLASSRPSDNVAFVMTDPFDLNRFVEAETPQVLAQVRAELRAGRKRTHWMWFVFPQLAGLGRSDTAQFYAITSLDEARAYLNHPILGPRLIELTCLVNSIEGRSADQIFQGDEVKFHSSMTLFSLASPAQCAFSNALNKYFDGKADQLTIRMLGRVQAWG